MVLLFVVVAVLAETALMIMWVKLIGALVTRRASVAALATAATAGTSLAVHQIALSGFHDLEVGGAFSKIAFVGVACVFGGPIGWTAAKPERSGGDMSPVVGGIRTLSGLATAVWVMPGSCVALLTGPEGLRSWFYVLLVFAAAFAATSLSRKRQGL